MSLKEQINADFMTAFKAKEMDKKNFLGLLKSEIATAESRPDFNGDADKTAVQVVKKMEKSLLESAGGESQSEEELEFLKPYLPKMMGRDEIVTIVTAMVESGADNIGLVMRDFNTVYPGKADNKIVKEVALELL